MIRLEASLEPSADWTQRAEAATQRILEEPPVTGERRFEEGVWRDIKPLLKQLTHSKCCYCEARLVGEHGDVDHYRPKGGVAERPDDHPGYYWLAYRWTNLLLACQLCNQPHRAHGETRGKGSHFPLSPGSTRAMNPADDLRLEAPLLLDPRDDAPEEHLSFGATGDVEPRGDSPRGKATIHICDLDRPLLRTDRLEYFQDVLRPAFEKFEASADDASRSAAMKHIRHLQQPDQRYVQLARQFFADPAAFVGP